MLSGGEQQRLALARAWALHPEVLFLDEPTANLDPDRDARDRDRDRAFHAAGTKIVMTTHNLGQARRLGDEVLFLHQGRARRARAGRAVFSSNPPRPRPRPSSKENCHGHDAEALLLALLLFAFALQAQQKFITVASTTSTEQSGLFKHLLPIFEQKTGIQVRVVALGTGQALDMGRRGDADVVFVHAKPLEEKFVAEGFGVQRFEVMYNDFVLVGPKSDPAKVGGSKDIVAALQKIKAGAGAVRLARRQERHALRRGRAVEGRRRRHRARTRAPGTARPARAWGRRSTPPPA